MNDPKPSSAQSFATQRRAWLAWAAASTAGLSALAGCGGGAKAIQPGGGGSGVTPPPAVAPVPPPAAPVTGPGPTGGATPVPVGLFAPLAGLNPDTALGYRFNRNSAAVFEDNDDQGQGLQLGMVAQISGGLAGPSDTTLANSTAVNCVAELRGPITQLDRSAGRLTVLGVQVQLGADTQYDSSTALNALALDAVVQVHGLLSQLGDATALFATRVMLAGVSSNPIHKTTGYVRYASAADASAGSRVFIGNVGFDVVASSVTGVRFPVPAGTLVQIRQDTRIAAPGSVALSVRAYPPATFLADARVRVQGYVTPAFGATNRSRINGQALVVGALTQVLGGSFADVRADRLVTIDGIWRQEGDAGYIDALTIRL
jgi:Domain of unknown function (DUF5666)